MSICKPFTYSIIILLFGCKSKSECVFTKDKAGRTEEICKDRYGKIKDVKFFDNNNLLYYASYKNGKIDSCFYWFKFKNLIDGISYGSLQSFKILYNSSTFHQNNNTFFLKYSVNGNGYMMKHFKLPESSEMIEVTKNDLFNSENQLIFYIQPLWDSLYIENTRIGFKSDTIWMKFDKNGNIIKSINITEKKVYY